mmetsp:Transcript_81564/g.249162  ORF Transcript_81564/g.249162 Transcript_81564/m.249162 type:complete len:282 (+) Transcript_81564:1443-2288(+)
MGKPVGSGKGSEAKRLPLQGPPACGPCSHMGKASVTIGTQQHAPTLARTSGSSETTPYLSHRCRAVRPVATATLSTSTTSRTSGGRGPAPVELPDAPPAAPAEPSKEPRSAASNAAKVSKRSRYALTSRGPATWRGSECPEDTPKLARAIIVGSLASASQRQSSTRATPVKKRMTSPLRRVSSNSAKIRLARLKSKACGMNVHCRARSSVLSDARMSEPLNSERISHPNTPQNGAHSSGKRSRRPSSTKSTCSPKWPVSSKSSGSKAASLVPESTCKTSVM